MTPPQLSRLPSRHASRLKKRDPVASDRSIPSGPRALVIALGAMAEHSKTRGLTLASVAAKCTAPDAGPVRTKCIRRRPFAGSKLPLSDVARRPVRPHRAAAMEQRTHVPPFRSTSAAAWSFPSSTVSTALSTLSGHRHIDTPHESRSPVSETKCVRSCKAGIWFVSHPRRLLHSGYRDLAVSGGVIDAQGRRHTSGPRSE